MKEKETPEELKSRLVDTVIEELKEQFAYNDYTVLEDLLKFIPNKNLVFSLDEDDWKNFPEVKLD
jgi:CO dehydrogenase/acetyl-CoA synthase beta subunit